jgi:hypothetical protein
MTTPRLAIAGSLALAALVASLAQGNAQGSTAPCAATPVHYGHPPAGDARLDSLPWIAPEPRSAGLVGHLFYYAAAPSVAWGKHRVGELRMYSGGRSPDNRVNMKILWSAPNRDGARLMLRGRRIGSADVFAQTLSVGPSVVKVPQAGCWRLTLTTGKIVTRVTVRVVPS